MHQVPWQPNNVQFREHFHKCPVLVYITSLQLSLYPIVHADQQVDAMIGLQLGGRDQVLFHGFPEIFVKQEEPRKITKKLSSIN